LQKKFAATLTQLDECGNLLAVASRASGTAEQFAAEFNIPKTYASYLDLACDPEIDIVYVATPHSLHYENVKLCLENNKNVLCEKSFTVNAAQACELICLARDRKLFLMEAFWTKFLPAYQQLSKSSQ